MTGFTLIELLIVVSILPILAFGLAGVMTSLGHAREALHARIDAIESARAAGERWRADVKLARGISFDGPQKMRIRRSADSGEIEVAYALEGGILRRLGLEEHARDEGRRTETLCRKVAELAFEPLEGGARMRLTLPVFNGTTVSPWRFEAFAVPLAPGSEGGR